ncbi:MAG TPA: hypothetical protein DCE41_03070 [Cytophagales bacterium]|nr:hypothetical protein [Cytophagales bacterium]HAA24455.1 hypothetical protein [Cytophagales bacterium]HAP59429.1 hypothetical protein [Cytophagales bacterium]
MKICVLQPDYSTTEVDFKNWDPPRDLSQFRPDDQVDHVFLNKLTTYRQLRDLSKAGYDIFVNLNDGYLDWEIPSTDVMHALDLLELPYTGPDATYYFIPKSTMKYVAYCADVKSPHGLLVSSMEELEAEIGQLSFPLFVKPDRAGDSLGIDERSFVADEKALRSKVAELIEEYADVLIEEYIEGREYSVLLAGNPDGKSCTSFLPVEYVFPKGSTFKTYELKTSATTAGTYIPVEEPNLRQALKDATERIFLTAEGMGYARADFRVDGNGDIYFIEMNFTCSVFYEEGLQGAADFILNFDTVGQAEFLQMIIDEGIARHQRKKKKYTVKGSSLSGYGLFAKEAIQQGETLFRGEERPQRLVSKQHVERTWTKEQQENFKHYAYPVGPDRYLIWDGNPREWIPQNHCCDANTAFEGLDVVALRDIDVNEELTLDYAEFLDHNIEPFACKCQSENCRGTVKGKKDYSFGEREK